AAVGVALLLFREDEDEPELGRMALGLTLFVLGGLGIISIARGNPSPADGFDAVKTSGGYLGAVVGYGLSTVLSSFRTVVVCLGLAVVGVVVFLGMSLASIGRGFRSAFHTLFGGGRDEDRPDDLGLPQHTEQIVDLREPPSEPEPEPEPDAVEIDE